MAELGHVHHVPMKDNKSKDPVREALGYLPKLAAELGAEWCLVAHVDEYLHVSSGNGTLADLIKACGDPDAISVCRRAFGSSGIRGIPKGQLRETHRRAAAAEAPAHTVTRGIKTLFRPDRVTRVAPHRPYF